MGFQEKNVHNKFRYVREIHGACLSSEWSEMIKKSHVWDNLVAKAIITGGNS